MSKLSKSEAGRLGGLAGQLKIPQRVEIYNTSPKICPQCNTPIPYEDRHKKKFCNRSCAASYNNITVPKRKKTWQASCIVCSSNLDHKGKFCSATCYGTYYRKYQPEDLPAIRRAQSGAYKAQYRARLKSQIPPDADLKAIKEFYDNCPPGYEVDHIIPISKGGLHTLNNLQYLTVSQNRSKGAKLNWVPKEG